MSKTEKQATNTDNDLIWKDDKHGIYTDQRDGKKYKVVKINKQIWLAENFNYTQNIPNITDETDWKNLGDNNTDQAWCYYDNNAQNGETYGALYTYAAAIKAVPKGWHLPKDEEFDELLNNYGGEGQEAYEATLAGENSLFNILLGGWRNYKGIFKYKDEDAGFWSVTEADDTNAWECHLYVHFKNIYLITSDKSAGLSIRLLKD